MSSKRRATVNGKKRQYFPSLFLPLLRCVSGTLHYSSRIIPSKQCSIVGRSACLVRHGARSALQANFDDLAGNNEIRGPRIITTDGLLTKSTNIQQSLPLQQTLHCTCTADAVLVSTEVLQHISMHFSVAKISKNRLIRRRRLFSTGLMSFDTELFSSPILLCSMNG